MTGEEIFFDLRKLAAGELEAQPDEIRTETRLEDLGADSLDLLALSGAIEAHYGIEFDEHAIANVETMADLVALVAAAAEDN